MPCSQQADKATCMVSKWMTAQALLKWAAHSLEMNLLAVQIRFNQAETMRAGTCFCWSPCKEFEDRVGHRDCTSRDTQPGTAAVAIADSIPAQHRLLTCGGPSHLRTTEHYFYHGIWEIV